MNNTNVTKRNFVPDEMEINLHMQRHYRSKSETPVGGGQRRARSSCQSQVVSAIALATAWYSASALDREMLDPNIRLFRIGC